MRSSTPEGLRSRTKRLSASDMPETTSKMVASSVPPPAQALRMRPTADCCSPSVARRAVAPASLRASGPMASACSAIQSVR